MTPSGKLLAAAFALLLDGVASGQNKVLNLSGFGQHVSIPHNETQNTTSAITIEMWAAIDRYSGRPVQKRSPSSGQFNLQLNRWCGQTFSYTLFGVLDTTYANPPTCISLPSSLPSPGTFGRWNHYAVTWSSASSRSRVYVNGALVSDIFAAGTTIRPSFDPLCFGDIGAWETQDFRGRLDNIRIWNVERTQNQIANDALKAYSAAEAQTMNGLIGSWTFDAGTPEDSTGRNSGVLNNGASIVDDNTVYSNADCNGDGVLDAYQIMTGEAPDPNGNGIPDVCEPCVPPTVASSPASQTTCVGTEVALIAQFNGTPPAFQWRRNGQPISGSNSRTFSILSLTPADAGTYDCVATNDCGSVTTDSATLTVLTPPAITIQPQAQPLVPSATASFAVAAIGSNLSFQWRRNGTPLTSGGRIGGATSSVLTITSAAATDQGSYDCVVTGPCGTATSAAAPLTCTPVFTQHPQGGSYSGGTTITLATSVATAGTTTYRWRKNGANIFNSQTYAGVLTPTLTIRANDPNDSGTYTLAVTNACGTAISDPAVIDVSCLSDFNLDGGVDGEDLFAFFGVWEQGQAEADVNQDGGVDFGDVSMFFEKWEAGC
jgi:hypothetical protein